MVIQSCHIAGEKTYRDFSAADVGGWGNKAVKWDHLEVTYLGLVAFIGAAFFAGWIASAGYFQVAKHWDQSRLLATAQRTTIPDLKHIAGCQEYRAAVLAGQIADDRGPPTCPSVHSVKSVPKAESPVRK